MTKVGYIYDERFLKHEMGKFHPESPKRLLAIKEVLDGNGIGREIIKIQSRAAELEELCFVHDEIYVKRVESSKDFDEVEFDPDTSANAHTWEAAQFAAGGAISCVEAVMKEDVNRGFCFVRPPGHHAEKSRAMGFCFFNNIAIAAEDLLKRKKVERVAIIDFDVHHGNGTQHHFYDRDDLYFISLHRFPFYPGSGDETQRGAGRGKGYNMNIPMFASSTDDDYKKAFDRHIFPEVLKYEPEFILVSAGFDAHQRDSLGGMSVTTEGFRWMASELCGLADEICNGRLVFVLEGGYDPKALRDSVEACLEEMVGR